jgi:hypothetical protein
MEKSVLKEEKILYMMDSKTKVTQHFNYILKKYFKI